MLLGQHCSMLPTILFDVVTPDCGLIQAQQYCSILLTTSNNVAPPTLLHPVFNNLLQLIIFPCSNCYEFTVYQGRINSHLTGGVQIFLGGCIGVLAKS